jgi:hypothetical protein
MDDLARGQAGTGQGALSRDRAKFNSGKVFECTAEAPESGSGAGEKEDVALLALGLHGCRSGLLDGLVQGAEI